MGGLEVGGLEVEGLDVRGFEEVGLEVEGLELNGIVDEFDGSSTLTFRLFPNNLTVNFSVLEPLLTFCFLGGSTEPLFFLDLRSFNRVSRISFSSSSSGFS